MSLDEEVDALAYDIAFWSVGVYSPDYPLEDLGSVALEVGDKLRAVAVMRLLSHASINAFCHNLIRSARARFTHLDRCVREQDLTGHHFCAGRVEPVTDALAAGDFLLAVQIVSLCPDYRGRDVEYEDDFCYANLLAQLAGGAPDAKRCTDLLDRWEKYLDGDASARFAVVKALVDSDSEAFGEAFEALLDEREAEIDELVARGQLEDAAVLCLRDVFVEGVALLRLADLRGLDTLPDYRMCPSLARLPMTSPFPGE